MAKCQACPHCSSEDTWTIKTRTHQDQTVHRGRVCRVCKKQWSTIEVQTTVWRDTVGRAATAVKHPSDAAKAMHTLQEQLDDMMEPAYALIKSAVNGGKVDKVAYDAARWVLESRRKWLESVAQDAQSQEADPALAEIAKRLGVSS